MPRHFKDLVGIRFGNLLVLDIVCRFERHLNGTTTRSTFRCQCDCGNIINVRGDALTRGQKACASCPSVTHGMSKTLIYHLWSGMVGRCTNPDNEAYDDYGGRGIYVSDEWLQFENFYRDMGERPTPKHSLDRVDNDGPYALWNCQWATLSEQANNKRSNIVIDFLGKVQTLKQWCRELNIDYKLAHCRIKRLLWNPVRAISTPTNKPFKEEPKKMSGEK